MEVEKIRKSATGFSVLKILGNNAELTHSPELQPVDADGDSILVTERQGREFAEAPY